MNARRAQTNTNGDLIVSLCEQGNAVGLFERANLGVQLFGCLRVTKRYLFSVIWSSPLLLDDGALASSLFSGGTLSLTLRFVVGTSSSILLGGGICSPRYLFTDVYWF